MGKVIVTTAVVVGIILLLPSLGIAIEPKTQLMLGCFWLMALIYFLPSTIASSRRHRQKLAIKILNFFAGWTFIGWLGALVWACTSDVET
jgi:Superinfection immunity protein